MNFQQHNILCPKCGESISIDDVLTRQIENTLRKEMEETQRKQELDICARLEGVGAQKRQLEIDRVESTVRNRETRCAQSTSRGIRKRTVCRKENA